MQLNPSRLGSKQHWDDLYAAEKQNFEEFGDEGSIWFGQEAVDKMVEWALKHCPMDTSKDGPYILDIGTGNGILPICLVQEGYPAANVCGIDYSQGSVELAKQVAEAREIAGITFQVADFINDDTNTITNMRKELGAGKESGWDLLTDKGTFDAMALSAPSDGSHPIDLYPQRVEELLSPGGYFLITSCNFTEDEIKSHFTSKTSSLKYHSRVKHPAFTFGGKSGATYCTTAFQKELPVNT